MSIYTELCVWAHKVGSEELVEFNLYEDYEPNQHYYFMRDVAETLGCDKKDVRFSKKVRIDNSFVGTSSYLVNEKTVEPLFDAADTAGGWDKLEDRWEEFNKWSHAVGDTNFATFDDRFVGMYANEKAFAELWLEGEDMETGELQKAVKDTGLSMQDFDLENVWGSLKDMGYLSLLADSDIESCCEGDKPENKHKRVYIYRG
jgi:hypothetical protein